MDNYDIIVFGLYVALAGHLVLLYFQVVRCVQYYRLPKEERRKYLNGERQLP